MSGAVLTLLLAAVPASGQDLYGDPLPPGALARLGTIRLHVCGKVLAFAPDEKAFAVASERYGAPLGAGLERLADEVRRDRRRRAEEAARRIPVKLLFPLVGCVLPAFALLTVAPLVAGALGSLRL